MRDFWTAILEVERVITCHPTTTTTSCSATPLGIPDSLTLQRIGWECVDLGILWGVAEQLDPVLLEHWIQLFCYTPWYSKIHPCFTRAWESQAETFSQFCVAWGGSSRSSSSSSSSSSTPTTTTTTTIAITIIILILILPIIITTSTATATTTTTTPTASPTPTPTPTSSTTTRRGGDLWPTYVDLWPIYVDLWPTTWWPLTYHMLRSAERSTFR